MIKGTVTVFTFSRMDALMMVNGATKNFMALESASILMVLASTKSGLTIKRSKLSENLLQKKLLSLNKK